jgi:copper chaperone CopZ
LLPYEAAGHVVRGDIVFCCAGCASARAVIERMGLSRFDALGGAPGPAARVDVDEAGALALDAALQAARAAAAGPGCRVSVDVDGVSCASCAWLVQKVAASVPGVAGATLNPARGQLELTVGAEFSASALSRALAEVGHRVTPASARRGAGIVDELVVRLGVSAATGMASSSSRRPARVRRGGGGRPWLRALPVVVSATWLFIVGLAGLGIIEHRLLVVDVMGPRTVMLW